MMFAKMLIAIVISFGVTPPAVVLLQLLQQQSVKIVGMTRRRKIDYAAIFGTDEAPALSHRRAVAGSVAAHGPCRDPRTMAKLAAQAETAGWDGILLEDYLVYQGQLGTPTYDPWVVLAAMAMATTRVRLGTLVTPVPRRRPWKLASEAVALDYLSEGRLILGVGAGDSREPSFTAVGEPAEPRVLAERLDEGLAILAGLWSGETVSYQWQHYHIDGLRLSPTPLQQPRIPIWVGGDWLVKGVRRRLTHWDGCCVYKGTPGTEAYRP